MTIHFSLDKYTYIDQAFTYILYINLILYMNGRHINTYKMNSSNRQMKPLSASFLCRMKNHTRDYHRERDIDSTATV